MKKFFLSIVIFVMAICANAQTNQYFWYNGNLMLGNPITQIDSVTFGEGEPADTLHILLPRTIIREVHDTVIITIHDTVCPYLIPEGALVGEFSVSATKKVRFSKGNLQYQASTGTWKFADNQYDTIGINNRYISTTDTNWIDLFGWGTGNEPTKCVRTGSNYATFAEWGININSTGNAWRTFSKDEWVYLFYTRPNAATLFAMGNIEGTNGVILLPDDWTLPSGVSFTFSTTQGLLDQNNYYFNNNGGNYSDNTYSAEQWAVMEASGAVFLPAAGDRLGQTGVAAVNTGGRYWSCTPIESEDAYMLRFDSQSLYPQYGHWKDFGSSIRLVQDVE